MANVIQDRHPIRNDEPPLSQQVSIGFKFHFLLECTEWRITSLGGDPLQFDRKTGQIALAHGEAFIHPLLDNIRAIVEGITRLGDGRMTPVEVPINNETGRYDWSSTTWKTVNLWVRVFEVGSTRVAKTDAIRADIYIAEKEYRYWDNVEKAVCSDPTVLESCDLSWKKEVVNVNKKMLEAKEKLIKAYIIWMKPSKTNPS